MEEILAGRKMEGGGGVNGIVWIIDEVSQARVEVEHGPVVDKRLGGSRG